ncbi:MAG: peptidase U32 family protein [Mangrovibacterium sp.]
MSQSNHAELLLPAGSVDSFRAAIRGGANAIYLGLKQFNARVRATNFGSDQLAAIMHEAHNHNVKIYITLNTVIKNNELPQLLNFLATLEANQVDAIIIQDWGVYHLAKKHFPKLALHASTQMANHNSIGVNHAQKLGFHRCVLARELSMPELKQIAQTTSCELEVFVHGALCYSFSGMCFFSSFVGGRGANRGMCSQACRMDYQCKGKKMLPFNLKDNEQIEQIIQLQQLGIHSLKVEGRMKSAEYVHRVGKAYRLALDTEKTNIAKEILQHDFARNKTSYFLGADLSNAIATDSNTGIYLGRVLTSSSKEILFESSETLQEGDRLRIQKRKSKNTINTRVENISQQNKQAKIANICTETIAHGDMVFWIGRKEENFPSRLMNVTPIDKKINPKIANQWLADIHKKSSKTTENNIFMRIDNLQWLEFIRPEELTLLALSLSKREWINFNYERKFIQKNLSKVALELPKFIAEGAIDDWKKIIETAHQNGLQNFVISHLSQKELLPKNCKITCNEQVYAFNDAAAHFLSQQANNFSYPLENDWQNLSSMKNTQGIFFVFFRPELFYSRMPIKIKNSEFEDMHGGKYHTCVKDGITITIPTQPVSLTQHRQKLENAGFHQFMFDLKHQTPNPKLLKQLFINFKNSVAMPESTNFNFNKEMY